MNTSKKTFEFHISTTKYLDVDEIWPDGDAPENPTREDVIAVIKQCGGPKNVIPDWDLNYDLVLEVDGVEVK